VMSLARHGFTRFYFINGHGGNVATVTASFSEIYAERSMERSATSHRSGACCATGGKFGREGAAHTSSTAAPRAATRRPRKWRSPGTAIRTPCSRSRWSRASRPTAASPTPRTIAAPSPTAASARTPTSRRPSTASASTTPRSTDVARDYEAWVSR
jgi:creatinine amidohydrolase